MKKLSVLGIVFLSVLMGLTSCQKQPSASFSASSTSVNVDELITFTNTSIDGETYSWDFGDGASSTEMNPTHSYSSGGNYNVKLTAYSKNGKKTSENIVAITVKNIITFNNSIFTDIDITVGTVEKTVSPGESVTFEDVPDNVSYTASTSGTTTSGVIVGLELTWDNTEDLSNGNSINLIASNDYFFLYMENNGSDYLTDLFVNYGLASETYDDIVIPNNGTIYGIGYYKAWSNSNVYCFLGDNVIYWDPITLPNTDNQSITLSNNYKKGGYKLLGHKKSTNPMELQVSILNGSMFNNNNSINEYCN